MSSDHDKNEFLQYLMNLYFITTELQRMDIQKQKSNIYSKLPILRMQMQACFLFESYREIPIALWI